MAKKLQEVQVVDLGSHLIKAATVSTKSGKPVVERLNAVTLKDSFSEPTRYFNDVRTAIDGLVNAGAIDRKVPLYYIVAEWLMPISIAYLNNQEPAGIEIALEDSLNKFVAAEGTSALEVTLKKSFRLREKPQGTQLQVVAAHTCVKYDILKELQEICVSRKIPFGGAFPKLFAYQELFRAAFSGRADVMSTISCMVDLGYNSANMVAFKEGKVVFHKALHMGARDFFNELRNLSAEKNFFQLTFPQFSDFMAKVGVTGDGDRIASLGLPITNPAAYEETTNNVCEELCTKIRLSLDYFSTVSATDFNTSMATVMAVRKGAEHIFLTGGLVATDGFYDRAAEQLSQSVQVLDPLEALGGPKPEAAPSSLHFAAAIGGGLAALADEADSFNIGLQLEGTQSAGASTGAGANLSENIPQWAHVVLVVVMLAVGYEYYEAWSARGKLLKEKVSAQNSLAEAKTWFTKYAEARLEEAGTKAKLELLREVALGKPAWASLFKEMGAASQGLVKINRFQVFTTYPRFAGTRAADGSMAGKQEKMRLTFKLSGEAKGRDQVFSFSRKLTEAGHFSDLEQPQLIETSTGANPYAAETLDKTPDCQFYFQLSGTLKGD
ncbi:MAG: hypothetical protein HY816_04775 [Candidatus Wallbacteria bacterium]|nr:hypothetical protein [Candidatus Wallbacteria bacterium]